jgi:hypothetical protein
MVNSQYFMDDNELLIYLFGFALATKANVTAPAIIAESSQTTPVTDQSSDISLSKPENDPPPMK